MQKVKDIMTSDPACCSPTTGLQAVAKMLVEQDCGAIPVVESETSRKPIGIVTDRDIACRVIAEGKEANGLTAGDCMSSPCVTVTPEARLDECYQKMEKNRIRRLVVVDADGCCCGIVAQADVALKGHGKAVAEVLREVSVPMTSASAVSRMGAPPA